MVYSILKIYKKKRIFFLNFHSGETYTNHHHIQVEPTNTLKRLSSPIKSQQIVDVQPNIIVQHQRPTSRLNSGANILLPSSTTKDPLNEAYIERDNLRVQVLTTENTHTNNGLSKNHVIS